MSFRLLLPIIAAMVLGLSACTKSEEPAEEQAAPATGAAQEEKAMGAPATEPPAAPPTGQQQ